MRNWHNINDEAQKLVFESWAAILDAPKSSSILHVGLLQLPVYLCVWLSVCLSAEFVQVES